MWSHASYKIPTVYRSGQNDSYTLDGLKRMTISKQDFYETHIQGSGNADHINILKVNQRLSWMMGAGTNTLEIMKLEESYRNVPMFSFEPTDITLSQDKKQIKMKINVEYNNVSAMDVVSYTATAINMNTVALAPLMRKLLPDERTFNNNDAFKFNNYGKTNVVKFKKDDSDYVSSKKYSH